MSSKLQLSTYTGSSHGCSHKAGGEVNTELSPGLYINEAIIYLRGDFIQDN